jgi:hypothetical protein
MVSRSRFGAASVRLLLTVLTSAALFGSGEASGAQLTAAWVDNSNGIATTRVERRLGTDTVFTALADVSPGATTYVDASLSGGTTYCYRAFAYDADGVSPYSDEACATSASDGLTVTVSKTGTGAGTIVSSPSGINCGAVCSATYVSGGSITLTATAASGSTFAGWSGGCVGTASCTLAGNVPVTVTATFTTVATPPPTPSPSLPVLSLIYNGKLRDRVGQGNTARAADGALDGTLTATLNASTGRTITALKLQSTASKTWDTDSRTRNWLLGVASTLDGSLMNNASTMAVKFAVPAGGSFVLFASDYAGIEFVPGATLTLTATFSDGTSATAATTISVAATGTVTPPAPSSSVALSMGYNGKLRDRVGQGNTALAADGALDGTLTVTLSASGGRTITGLMLTGPGAWDTDAGTGSWVLGVATALDALPLINNPATMAVNFSVPDGGTFLLFASDSGGAAFVPGAALTVTATFSDGTTARGTTTVGGTALTTLNAIYNGKLRDRVGQGNTVLSSDGVLDGTLTVTLSASGGRTVTGLKLESMGLGTWDTDAGSGFWALGVATALDDLPLINNPATVAVNFAVPDGGTFLLFASDSGGAAFVPGATLTVTATFSDGTTANALTQIQ